MEITETLIERARAFDEAALTEIYQLMMPGLYRYARRFLPDADLVEECVAETFSRLLQAWHRGGGSTDNLKAYLCRIAHNWITDYYRRKKPQALPLEPFEELLGSSHSPAGLVEQNLEMEQVRAALSLLTPEQRQVIVLKYLEGWPNQDVASALGKPVGAVKALQYRGIAALQRMLIPSAEASS